MMKIGRFNDPYRGDGVFASFRFRGGYLLFALRWRWHFYRVVPSAKPDRTRWYVGPLEIEIPHAMEAA